MLDARHLARLLDGVVAGRDRILAPGPGHSRTDRSMSIKLDDRAPDGFIVISFANDTWQDCKAHILQRLGLPQWQPGDGHRPRVAANAEVDKGPRWTADEIKRINLARGTWRDGVNPAGTLAEIYLQRRRLDLDDVLVGTVLRFNSSCPWHDENTGQTIKVPAMISAFRQIGDNTITAVQRTRLDGDGRKVDRRMLGVVHNAAIKLAMPDNGELAIAEGVETAAAGQQLGFRPAWALGSCGAISRLPIIDGVKQLTLLGENDAASADAVKACSTRWLRAGCKVRIAMPDDGYNDMADELAARATS
jgi:putative DNA primase/helicase